jgi:class 3 adenylate cyclase
MMTRKGIGKEDHRPVPNLLPSSFPAFGDQLHNYRTLRGLSIEQVAGMVGLPPQAVRDMEQGKRPAPPEDVAIALAHALRLQKRERRLFLDSAQMASPLLRALLGQPTAAEHPSFSAAILVFLLADIRGYTRFTQEHGDQAAAQLATRFAELAQAVVEQWAGHLIESRGDEVLAVFASAQQAVQAAQALQTRYAEETRAHPDFPVGIGIGLDVGEAVPVAGGGYRGAALNRAARLCSLAGPGEVLISAGVMYLAPHVEGVTFVARGQEQLKGFDTPTPILLAAPAPARAASESDTQDPRPG